MCFPKVMNQNHKTQEQSDKTLKKPCQRYLKCDTTTPAEAPEKDAIFTDRSGQNRHRTVK